MAENFFKETLQHHMNQTRAGLYGQFEHAFNFQQGVNQDAKYKIGPGESIVFTGLLLSGPAVTVTATNNLLGPSGAGFVNQTNDPGSKTIVAGSNQKEGQVVFDFDVPTGGGSSQCISYTSRAPFPSGSNRYEAIDGNDAVIFTRSGGSNALDIVKGPGGEFYCTGSGGSISFRRSVAEFDSAGTKIWEAGWDGRNHEFVAYDPTHDFVVAGVTFALVRGYDPTLAPFPMATGNETWETKLSAFTHQIEDMKASGDGFVYVALQRTSDTYDGATPGTRHNIFKIDAATGVIVAAYETLASVSTNPQFVGETRLAVNSSGELLVAQRRSTIGQDGGAAANVFKLDSSLNLLARVNVDWSPSADTLRRVSVTTDQSDNVYLVNQSGYAYKYDTTLATADATWGASGKRIAAAAGDDAVDDIGHDAVSELILGVGGQFFGFDGFIRRYDSDGVFISSYALLGVSQSFGQLEVLGSAGGGPGPNLGSCFTSDHSTRPPGKVASIVAAKYADGNVTDLFFNSCETQDIDPDSWSAVHSVAGAVPFGPNGQWAYHSPL